ncbi:MAG: protein translocase subunit SecD [Lachnospiraceae bacterium]|jgi:SecD/SecF fusion protein|nr:protein translocase subunit SecD [Lachnospiraceae bacterium]MCI1327900.1 protein translocase subunit SecD [Lachnospiraceae bacterium]
MKKKQSVVTLIIMIVLTLLLGYTVIFGWGPTGTGSMKNIRTGLDLSGGVSITYEATEKNPSSEDMDDTVYKLQQRVDQYSTEAPVYKQGTNRISVEIPGVSDANAILEELGKPGSLVFQDAEGNTVLSGTDVAGAEGVATQDQTSGERKYVVELELTKEGTEKFAEATEANVGKQISIVYDGTTISSPTVNEAITGGKAEITGMSSIDEAKNLASNIRIGSLSLELNEVYSNVVGAQLGQEALDSSLAAGIIGICLVMLLMIVVFRISGVASSWALLLFTMLDLLCINAFDVTLTLPGIAGVLLTIGMAVDANVIIYTRTKEEISNGSSVKGAIKAGFHKAFSAIFDGNVTTLIAAAVLGALGTGSIRGFAITLAMGVIISMFSALVLSRIISNTLYGLGVRDKKYYGEKPKRAPWKFLQRKVIFFLISIILLIMIPVGLAYQHSSRGSYLNLSLDFIGGTATTVDFGEDLSLTDLDKKVEPVVSGVTGDSNIQFQKVTNSTQVIIKTRELSVDERQELNDSLAKNFDKVDESKITAENISSTISGEMRSNAVRAVIIAIVCMLIYIWVRFRDIRFATSAILALAHDICMVFLFYVWSRFSVGSTFIAVMLTILGYSINDTIVVFDRIREELRTRDKRRLIDTTNQAITDTFSRSIYTSLTTFMTIFVLFLLGVPSIREFSLPIIVGIIAGTYSSICIASPLWYLMRTKIGKNRWVEPVETVSVEGPEASDAPSSEDSVAASGTTTSDSRPGKAQVSGKKKKDRSGLQSTKPKRGRNRRRG